MENIWTYNGRHLLLDGRARLINSAYTDSNVGISIINEIVETIDMTLILPPIAVNFPHSKPELLRIIRDLEGEGLTESKTVKNLRHALNMRDTQSYGYSIVAIIAESHLSIHTFPEHGWITFDTYSCKEFDTDKVFEILQKYFKFDIYDMNVVNRTIPKFPEEIGDK